MAQAPTLTDAQWRNLRHVRDFGQPLPRNKAAYHCRIKGLTEFIWRYEDGSVATMREQPSVEGREPTEIVGERLTEAGRAALERAQL